MLPEDARRSDQSNAGGHEGYSNAQQLRWMDGWFVERSPFWQGQALALEVDHTLHSEHTGLQDCMVLQSSSYGRMLALDGAIQLTERDESAYQESIAHFPLCALHNPARSVLVVGGGDGGVVREIVRHASVERIDVAELDGRVISLCKQYFPSVAIGFNDERVNVHMTDGSDFVNSCASNSYDVVIVDSSDPVGPGAALFTQSFHAAVARVLRPGGVASFQAECMWIHLDTITNMASSCAKAFGTGSTRMYASVSVPTYPCGQIGFILCSKPEAASSSTIDFSVPQRDVNKHSSLGPLQYYNSSIHRCVCQVDIGGCTCCKGRRWVHLFVIMRFCVQGILRFASICAKCVRKLLKASITT